MSAGSIVISLLLNSASFETDTARASKIAEKRAREIQAHFEAAGDRVKTAFAGIFAGLTVGTAVVAFRSLTDQLDALNDAADATGASVENISGLEDIAKRTGASLETVETSMVKLNQALNTASDPNSGAAGALKAIGLSAEELKSQDPAQALLSIAKALDSFADDGNKARITQELFGKSLKEVAPFLHDLADAGQINATVTKAQAEEAEKFNKQIFALQTNINSAARAVVSDMLPALTAAGFQFSEVSKQSGVLQGALAGIGELSSPTRTFFETIIVLGRNVAFVFEAIGTQMGGMAAQIDRVAHLDFKGAAKIWEMRKEDLAKLRADLDAADAKTQDRTRANTSGQGGPNFVGPPDSLMQKKSVQFNHYKPPSTTKSLLDEQLKSLDQYIAAEQKLLSSRDAMLDRFYQADLISIADYYSRRADAQSEALENTRAAYAKEISATQSAIAKAPDESARIALQTKLIDIRGKLADAEREASEQTVKGWLDQQDALQAYKDKLSGLSADILELQRQGGAAAGIRFDVQNRQFRDRLTAEGNTGGLAQLDQLRQLSVAQADFNQLQADSQIITDRLANAEERVHIAQQAGATTELGALRQLSGERQAAVQQLEGMVIAMESVAKQSENKALIVQAERARVELEKLAASSDLVTDKYAGIFEQGLSGFFTDIASGSKSAADAFRDATLSILNDMGRLASQEISHELLGNLKGSIQSVLQSVGIAKAPDALDGLLASNGAFGTVAAAGAQAANDAGPIAAATAISTAMDTAAATSAVTISTGIETSGAAAAGTMAAGIDTSGAAAAAAMASAITSSGSIAAANMAAAISSASAASSGGDVLGSFIAAMGFDEGGYTGAGSVNQPAGIVHAGEFVTRQAVTHQPGAMTFLSDFNKRGMAALPAWAAVMGLRGYAGGGPVTSGQVLQFGKRGADLFTPSTAGASLPRDMAAGGKQAAPVVNVRNVNAFDTEVIGDYMGSDSGEQKILNVVRRNPGLIRQISA